MSSSGNHVSVSVEMDNLQLIDVEINDKTKMGPPESKPKRNWSSSNKYLFNTHSLRLPEDIKMTKKARKKNDDKNTKRKSLSTTTTTPTPPVSDKKTEFNCHLCERSFLSQCSLQKHLKRHTGEQLFECETCKKRFFSKFSLTRHRIATHDRDSTLTERILCNICDKRFSSKEWLVIHLRSHTGENPFACEYCDKKFTCQNGLNRHSLTHKTEKSFLCFECGKMFQSSQSLRIHLESHVTDRKYNCDQCRMRFKRALDLQRHGLVHREVPMLSCPLPQCEHQFRRKDNLLRHLQLTHDQTREEAHETFNMLDTSCKSSSRGKSASSSVVGISDVQYEISSTAEDSETTQDSTTLLHPQSPTSKKTKVRAKSGERNKTNSPPKRQSSKSKARNFKSPPVQVENVNLKNKMVKNQEMNLVQTTSTIRQICTPTTSAFEDAVPSSPKKSNSSNTSVTTSVIRLAKSSSSVVTSVPPVLSRKRHKRVWELGNNPEEEGVQEQRSSPPPFQTLLTTPAPYPSRNPSPGQEYINYLNSLNNPVAFRVRDRSSSFTNRNQYNSSQPSYKYSYELDGPSYSLIEESPVNFTNSYSFPSASFRRENSDQARNVSTLHLTPPSYNIESFEYPVDGIRPTHFRHSQQHEHNLQPEVQECSNSVGYLDLSSSDPEKRRISFEPSSPQLHSQSMYQISDTDATSISNTFLPQYSSGHGSNYQQQSVQDMTKELTFHQASLSVQSNKFGEVEEYCNYNNIVPLIPLESEFNANLSTDRERPCNVTVIKRVSASMSQNQNHGVSSTVQNHQDFIQDFMQAGAVSESQDLPEKRRFTETGSLSLQQHQVAHPVGGKDMIVNRDPRKNFLHRESFSRSRNQD